MSDFKLTKEQLQKCLSKNKDIDILYTALDKILPEYYIDTLERVAAFISQCSHESVDFTILKENLNYSSERLLKVWPKRFTKETAILYHRNPEKIANKVYANRLGNSIEQSGDGWKYRGRGAIQLTGKSNYQSFANSIEKSLEDTVEYLETICGAVESAAWFWEKNDCNSFADKKDIEGLTKKINGGINGLQERIEKFNNILEILRNE